jgi:hypothetical protein
MLPKPEKTTEFTSLSETPPPCACLRVKKTQKAFTQNTKQLQKLLPKIQPLYHRDKTLPSHAFAREGGERLPSYPVREVAFLSEGRVTAAKSAYGAVSTAGWS